ncbi:hypothetical protein B0H14DRAFT_3734758 [Mycena olivaceomarginata]|nr:hypothetical protein B0H14DRAFT_3734758 [Mycena olivaceomarginata]
MQEGEDENFLRFATALKILVGSSITREGLNRAKQLLEEYLLGFSQVRYSQIITGLCTSPTLDFGPIYGFWAFLPERLNKILKNLNTNNWGGGLLEVSMMREFHRMAQLDGMLYGILDETSGENLPLGLRLEHQFIQCLFRPLEDREAFGTIQDAATHEHTSSRVVPGSIAEKAERIENDAMRVGLVNYYRLNGHNISLASLDSFAETYNYAFLDGRRITPTTCSRRGSGSALIQIRYKGEQYSGAIHTILQHKQRGIPRSEPVPLAFILWMIPGDTPLDNGSFVWNNFLELGVETWLYKKYAPTNDPNYPPQVLPLADIKSQISRGKIGFTIPPLWITTTMDRFPTSFTEYGDDATADD